MKRFLYDCQLYLLFLFVVSSCRLVDIPQAAPNNAAVATREILPTREAVILPTETLPPEPTQPTVIATPENTPTQELAPTPETVLFDNPAGYQLIHPADWRAQDVLGQTVLTPIGVDLTQLHAINEHPLVLIAAGPAAGRTAEELSVDIPKALLNDDRLTPVEVQSIVRGDAQGARAIQVLMRGEETVESVVEAVIREQLFAVALAIMPENTAESDKVAMETILASVSLTKSQFELHPAEYDLSAKRVDALNRSLSDTQNLAGGGEPLTWGESVGRVAAGEAAVYTFAVEEAIFFNLEVVPSSPDFDVTVDLLDSVGNSVLPDSQLLDESAAGEAESLSAVQLSSGNYVLVVRGFALTGGSFALNVSRSY